MWHRSGSPHLYLHLCLSRWFPSWCSSLVAQGTPGHRNQVFQGLPVASTLPFTSSVRAFAAQNAWPDSDHLELSQRSAFLFCLSYCLLHLLAPFILSVLASDMVKTCSSRWGQEWQDQGQEWQGRKRRHNHEVGQERSGEG